MLSQIQYLVAVIVFRSCMFDALSVKFESQKDSAIAQWEAASSPYGLPLSTISVSTLLKFAASNEHSRESVSCAFFGALSLN